jgi:hypothetical protein
LVGFEDCGDFGEGTGVLRPLSGISRRERVTQEIDVPGAIAFDTGEDGEPKVRVEDEREQIESSTNSRRAGEFWLASKTAATTARGLGC